MRKFAEREAFYSQPKEIIESLKPEDPVKFYKLLKSGQMVCEIEMDLGAGEDSVEIAQIADCHINYINGKDMIDDETPYTHECRKAFRDGQMVPQTIAALEACSYSDATVVTGDILDYMTWGTLDAVEMIFPEKYPDIMMTIGWHDMTKQMQTRRPNRTPEEERLARLQAIWPHSIHYYSRDIGKKIIAVCMGNAHVCYTEYFSDKLLADIERARNEGKYILVFQHEPFSTRKESDREITPSYTNTGGYGVLRNFFDADKQMASPKDDVAVTAKIYDIIRSNADVIKGLFAGHYHNQFYTEIPAWYEKDGERVETFIPQHVAHIVRNGKNGMGYLVRIIVK